MTLVFNSTQEQRNCVVFRTAIISPNILSNTWKIGLCLKMYQQLRKLCNKKTNISSLTISFLQTITCREKNLHSIGSTKNPTNGTLTLVPWPFHKWLTWLKQNIWTPEICILLEQHICRLTMLDQILCFLCPEGKSGSPFKTISSAHCILWSVGTYHRRLYGPSFSHEFR